VESIFLYSTGRQGHQEGSQLEEAIIEAQINKNRVFFLSCDSSIGGCMENPFFNRARCKICKYFQKKNVERYLPESIEQHFVSEYLTPELIALAKNARFNYNSIEELKHIQYKGVDIGYGAVSTYVTLTRNLVPRFDDELKKYINSLLVSEIVLTEIVDGLLNILKPDRIIFHNGRLAQYRPILNLAQSHNINFLCTEGFVFENGLAVKNYFYNEIPHKAIGNTSKFFDIWDKSKNSIGTREKVARSFYENRKNSVWSGDKIYTDSQKYGLLPDNIDSSKEIICIFNSSEDEYFSVDKDLDESVLFSKQIVGLKAIFEHYKEDETKHFILRIHPNLSKISYKYHTDFYKLRYDNVTIIRSDSPVSTYSLIEIAEKIIVFNSTVGIESVYWGKPVISLAESLYSMLDVVYSPKDIDGLWSLIDNKDLKCKCNDNVLKYGFFYMTDSHEHFKYIDNNQYTFHIGIWKPKAYGYQTFLRSKFLYSVSWKFFDKVFVNKLGFTSKFKIIPADEE
jgi:hypothetical protein